MKTSIAVAPEERSIEEIYRVLKRDIADRLRGSCADWAPSEFDGLVEKVTRTAMKYPSRRERSLIWSA